MKSEKSEAKGLRLGFGFHSILFSLFTFIFSLFTSSAAAQCALVCQGSITVALDAQGEAHIYPPMLLQSSVGCSNNFSIEIFDTLGNELGTVLTADLLGMPLTAVLTHPASGNSCDTEITLIDANPPVMDCGFDTLYIWCNEPSIPDSLGYPEVSDNATETDSIDLVFEDVFTDLDCFDSVGLVPVTAHIARTWTATDESGNEATCTQHIFLKRAVLSQVVFPDNRDGIEAPKLQCGLVVPDSLELAGLPMVVGFPLNIAGDCELIVSFNDQQVPVCGGSRKIYRTWTVFDLCTENFLVNVQVIVFEDKTPPTITCPAPVSFETYSSSCSAQVWLPQATAEDACSGAIVNVNWAFGAGYGPFNTVPAGIHTVTYTATDGCSNAATCQMAVTVEDTKKPTALCELQVQVSLEEDGTALVFAGSFDNNSYDNCGIGQLLVKRGDDLFDEFVSFDCSDIGAAPIVTLRVVDVHGLWKECTSAATVIDQVAPEILCPANVQINCGANYNDLNLTGQPFATDNCGTVNTSHTNIVNLNNCGNGTVLRTWLAADGSGNQAACQQAITISDNTEIAVVFPDDLEFYTCEPGLDPSQTGEPLIVGADCEQLQITHTDYIFYTAEPSCFQLIRNWGVVDWCSFQPNNPQAGGFWEHTQVIEVRDSVAPVLACPANLNVGIMGSGCQTFVNVPLPGIDDCSQTLTVSNSSPFDQNPGGPASGIYPKGTNTVTYTVSDGCGNTATCSVSVTVKDSQAPNPVCNNGVSVTIQQNGMVTLTPGMINQGSNDNCTAQSALILQVSPNTFTCQDLGTEVVTLTVTDQSGNSSFCQTNVVVQDNLNVCGSGTTAFIAGKMEMENGEALSQKLVGLSGGISMAVYTDVDGTYDFPNLPLGEDYTLTPSYNAGVLNGVTTFDIVLIQKHILNISFLDTPYRLIAADANGSGNVSTFDMLVIRKLVLFIEDEFPSGVKSWRFVPASHVFSDPADPWATPIPNSLSVNNLSFNLGGQDFIGVKIGDVNGSADPLDIGGGADDRDFDNTLIFNTKDIELVAGHEYAIPFVAASSQALTGFQFTFDFEADALGFLEVGAAGSLGLQGGNVGTKHAADGALTVSWDNAEGRTFAEGETMFELKFFAKKNTQLREVLTINSRLTPAEAYRGDFRAPAAQIERMGVGLVFGISPEKTLRLLQNAPNPFYGKTTVGFYLPDATDVMLRIFDAQGRLLQTHEGHYAKGQHEVPLNMAGTGANGLLFCRLETPGNSPQTIRMILIASD